MSVEAGRVKVVVDLDPTVLQSGIAEAASSGGAELETRLGEAGKAASEQIVTSLSAAAEESASALAGIGGQSFTEIGAEAEATSAKIGESFTAAATEADAAASEMAASMQSAATEAGAAYQGTAAEVAAANAEMATTTEVAAGEMEGSFAATAGAAGGLIAAFVEFEVIKKAVENFEALEKVNRQLEQALKDTDEASGTTVQHLDSVSQSIARQTGIYQENIAATQRFLLAFPEIKDSGAGAAAILDRATQAAVDMSAQFGGNATRTTRALARALEDPGKAATVLTRYIGQLDTATQNKIQTDLQANNVLGAQETILSVLEERFHGQAAAAATDLDKQKEKFHELSQTIGKDLLPIVDDLAKGLGVVAVVMQAVPAPVVVTVAGIVALKAAVGLLGPKLLEVKESFSSLIERIQAHGQSTAEDTAVVEESEAPLTAQSSALSENAVAYGEATAAAQEHAAALGELDGQLSIFDGELAASQEQLALFGTEIGTAADQFASLYPAMSAAGISAADLGTQADIAAVQVGLLSQGLTEAAVEAGAASVALDATTVAEEGVAAGGIGLSAALGPVGILAAGAALAISLFGKSSDSAAQDAKSLTDAVEQQGKSLGDAFTADVQQAVGSHHELAAALHLEGLSYGQVVTAVEQGGKAYDDLRGKLGASIVLQKEGVGASEIAQSQLDKLKAAYDKSSKSIGDLTTAQQDNTKATQSAASSMAEDALAAQNLAPALSDAVAGSGTFATALTQADDASVKLTKTTSDLRGQLAGGSPEADAFIQKLAALAPAAQKDADAMFKQGATYDQVRDSVRANADAVFDWATNTLHLGVPAASTLRDSILAVANSSTTASDAVSALGQSITDYENKLFAIGSATDKFAEQEKSLQDAAKTAAASHVTLAEALAHTEANTVEAHAAAGTLRDSYESLFQASAKVVQSVYDQDMANGKNQEASIDAANAAKTQADQTYALVLQMTGSATEAQAAADQVRGLANNMTIAGGSAANATPAVRGLAQTIDGLHDKTVTISTFVNMDALNALLAKEDAAQQKLTILQEQDSINRAANLTQRWGGVVHAAAGLVMPQARIATTPQISWAEPQTGGEAYIPKNGNYDRSMGILGEAAGWYGAQLVPSGATTLASTGAGTRGGGLNIGELHVHDTDVIADLEWYERTHVPAGV